MKGPYVVLGMGGTKELGYPKFLIPGGDCRKAVR